MSFGPSPISRTPPAFQIVAMLLHGCYMTSAESSPLFIGTIHEQHYIIIYQLNYVHKQFKSHGKHWKTGMHQL